MPSFRCWACSLKNSSGQPLNQGPITVYEDGSYAGDTRILDLQPNEERLLSYALDQAVEIKSDVKTTPSPDMHLKMGETNSPPITRCAKRAPTPSRTGPPRIAPSSSSIRFKGCRRPRMVHCQVMHTMSHQPRPMANGSWSNRKSRWKQRVICIVFRSTFPPARPWPSTSSKSRPASTSSPCKADSHNTSATAAP